MKDIRIFVASSKELERERNYLAFLVLARRTSSRRAGCACGSRSGSTSTRV